MDRTVVAPGNLDAKYAALRAKLLALDTRLNGNPAKNAIGAWNDPSIGDRLFHALIGTFRSTYGPTPLIRSSLDIAKEELQVVRDELQGLIDNDIANFEKELQALGAPWTPGQSLPTL